MKKQIETNMVTVSDKEAALVQQEEAKKWSYNWKPRIEYGSFAAMGVLIIMASLGKLFLATSFLGLVVLILAIICHRQESNKIYIKTITEEVEVKKEEFEENTKKKVE